MDALGYVSAPSSCSYVYASFHHIRKALRERYVTGVSWRASTNRDSCVRPLVEVHKQGHCETNNPAGPNGIDFQYFFHVSIGRQSSRLASLCTPALSSSPGQAHRMIYCSMA